MSTSLIVHGSVVRADTLNLPGNALQLDERKRGKRNRGERERELFNPLFCAEETRPVAAKAQIKPVTLPPGPRTRSRR